MGGVGHDLASSRLAAGPVVGLYMHWRKVVEVKGKQLYQVCTKMRNMRALREVKEGVVAFSISSLMHVGAVEMTRNAMRSHSDSLHWFGPPVVL
ncbi:hypothetical protein AAFF_G00185240 [Aldrovandia affinis]|uniref:Uncharacterized protein n=1 Tax=Aldrovandia affinis TaxID=143900 RepID=A0AAD7RK50_9TELE|nr:hypothetical protein AAFF_G00185240 [Aldrovandia affinis]